MPLRRVLLSAGVIVAVLAAAPIASAQIAGTPPTTPTNVRVTGVTDHTVSLAWDPSTETDRDPATDGDPFVGYEIFIGDESVAVAERDREDVVVRGLAQGKTFTFAVEAYDRHLHRSARATVTGTTARDVTAPATPQNFKAASRTPQTMELTWFNVNEHGDTIDFVVTDGTTTKSVDAFAGGWRDLAEFSTATPGSYTYTVRSRDDAGNLSAPASVTVEVEHEPPTAPRNLRRITGTEDRPGVIQWDPSTDNSGKVLYRLVIGRRVATTTAKTSIDVQALLGEINNPCLPRPTIPSGRWDMTVEAFDSSANTARSNSIPIVVD